MDDATTVDEASESSAVLEKAQENMQAAAAVLDRGKVNGVNLNLEALIQNIANMAEGSTIAESQVDFKWDAIRSMTGALDLFNSECNVVNLGEPG